jgi:aminoglycoside phosphotransferase (APT) family kinase protein
VCHGDLTPVHVVRNGDDAPGVPVNWTATTVADPEYDVAATTVGFWSSALYGNAVQRRALKMVREPLASAYLSAYREVAPWPLDDGRLRYWQAFHLHRLAAAIDRRVRTGPGGPWDPATHVATPVRSLRDVDRRFREVSAG